MIEKETEYALIQSILNGDKEQFTVIVKEYQGIVANLCYKLVGNKLEADEVVQQVFVELYLSLPRFRFESKLSTFIYRITVNVISKMMGKNSRYVSFDSVILDNRTSGITTEEAIMREEQHNRVRKAIGSLKYEQRTALALYTYDNFSYNDIADVMQVSLSKVESLIFRAKKSLKKMLDTPSK